MILKHKYVNLTTKDFLHIEYLQEMFDENKSKGGTRLLIVDQMQYIDQNLVSILAIQSDHYNVTRLLLTRSFFHCNKLCKTL